MSRTRIAFDSLVICFLQELDTRFCGKCGKNVQSLFRALMMWRRVVKKEVEQPEKHGGCLIQATRNREGNIWPNWIGLLGKIKSERLRASLIA